MGMIPTAAAMVVVYVIAHKLLLPCVENQSRMVLIFMFKNIDFVTFLTDKSSLGEA